MKKWIRITLCIAGALVLAAVVLFVCIRQGVILLNNPARDAYPVRGVDVSAYQGEIDWQVLASQQLAFAFIKATEGSSYVDPCYARNARAAAATHLRVGAYHFFSYDSAGAAQAENYISQVERTGNMLPPVVDLEFYGDKEWHPPAREDVQRELNVLLQILETHYGCRPILYATGKSYRMYLAGDYAEYDIWIRNVYTAPALPDGRDWTFWQYTDRLQLDGYQGQERFIDGNVFCGSPEEFEQYGT